MLHLLLGGRPALSCQDSPGAASSQGSADPVSDPDAEEESLSGLRLDAYKGERDSASRHARRQQQPDARGKLQSATSSAAAAWRASTRPSTCPQVLGSDARSRQPGRP